jgi:hypothetical protein
MMNTNPNMLAPQPRGRDAQDTFRTIRRWLLCIVATIAAMFLVVPLGLFLSFPTYALILSTSLWSTPLKVASGLFAGTNMSVEEVLALGITGLYFGIVLALASSKNKSQINAAIGLIAVYIMGWLLLAWRTIEGMS